MPYYEDIEVGEVHHFGRYEITREEIIEFASRYDPQAFHLDDDAAKEGPFGALAASGWMTAAVTMNMLVEGWIGHEGTSLGGAGVRELNWLRPVWPGDVLSVRAVVLEKRRSKARTGMGILDQKIETLDATGEPVMAMRTMGLVRTRDAAGRD
ncbi:MaoC family dehydratase [Croceicoccus sp. BE223]|uniref:MaoC family dehydratase n=1 Tax=Croceicoccus sp. BE223 TaxID=2817716 RepID=UPI0028568EF3|nr:MaoC family dehydratase [Croceicoccus sp. BE223]MDR7103198.1 acyl dehydratase [Croceicoccus sp. BE223]